MIGKRVLVVGCPGSGKSTFARRLRDKTGLPLIYLDNLWWRPDRTHISREDFDRRLEALLGEARWIMDGDYSRTFEPRIRACDTVIFLDYDEEVCMRGITERLGKPRPDMPWTDTALDPELVELVRRFRTENRPVLLGLLAQYPEKQQILLHSRSEADAWLDALGNEGETPPAAGD